MSKLILMVAPKENKPTLSLIPSLAIKLPLSQRRKFRKIKLEEFEDLDQTLVQALAQMKAEEWKIKVKRASTLMKRKLSILKTAHKPSLSKSIDKAESEKILKTKFKV